MGSFIVRTVNGKQANYELLNVSFLHFEEAFFDKLVHKTSSVFTPLYYVDSINID